MNGSIEEEKRKLEIEKIKTEQEKEKREQEKQRIKTEKLNRKIKKKKEKKATKKTEWTKEKITALKAGVLLLLTISICSGIVLLVFSAKLPILDPVAMSIFIARLLIAIFLIVIPTIHLLKSLKSIPEEERWLIEVFGKYYRQAGPGLRLILHFLEKVRAEVPIWEEAIPLFIPSEGEPPIKVDFKDGSAGPQDAFMFTAVKNPDTPDDDGKTGIYKTVYEIKNWRIAGRALVENALRSYLNILTVDEGIEGQRAGYDLLGPNGMQKDTLGKTQADLLKEAFSKWGRELIRSTIGDFALDDELIKAREELHRSGRELKSAKLLRETRAQKTMGAAIDAITIAIGKDPAADKFKFEEKEAIEFVKEMLLRQMSIEGKALYDIRTGSGGKRSLEDVLAGLLTLRNVVK